MGNRKDFGKSGGQSIARLSKAELAQLTEANRRLQNGRDLDAMVEQGSNIFKPDSADKPAPSIDKGGSGFSAANNAAVGQLAASGVSGSGGSESATAGIANAAISAGAIGGAGLMASAGTAAGATAATGGVAAPLALGVLAAGTVSSVLGARSARKARERAEAAAKEAARKQRQSQALIQVSNIEQNAGSQKQAALRGIANNLRSAFLGN